MVCERKLDSRLYYLLEWWLGNRTSFPTQKFMLDFLHQWVYAALVWVSNNMHHLNL